MRFLRLGTGLGPVLLSLGPVLLSIDPPIQANRTLRIGQNSVKYRPARESAGSPFQQRDELHQKDLRKVLEFLHILGPGTEGVSAGGHYSSLKSNRRVLRVRRVDLAATCRYSSQTAVKFHKFTKY